MAIHLSISVWKILWMEEPERLQSKGLPRVRGTEHTHIYKAHSWILYSLLLPAYLITCSWIQFSSCLGACSESSFREGLLHSKFSKILCIRKYPPFSITFKWQSSWIRLGSKLFSCQIVKMSFQFPFCLVLFRTLKPVWFMFFPTWKLLEFFSLALIT